jgi:hypothetical protein
MPQVVIIGLRAIFDVADLTAIQEAPLAVSDRIGQTIHVVAVSDVSLLDDGRVAALALLNEPVLPPHGPARRLIDRSRVP